MATTSLHKLVSTYKNLEEIGDPRSNQYPLVASPVPMLVTFALYLIFAQQGPRFFRDRKPLDLKPVLAGYNFFMVLFSAYMFNELLMAAYQGNYSITCQPYERLYTPSSLRMVNACWVYYISKTIEIADTVFLVVRKRGQLSFLHVFHHASVIIQTWIFVKFVPSGHGTFHAGCNTFVHTVMYFYFFLACFPAFKKYLWWKKYLTILQMVQFIAVMVHIAVGVYHDCDYPYWTISFAMFEVVMLLALFGNFYIQTYFKKRHTAAIAKTK